MKKVVLVLFISFFMFGCGNKMIDLTDKSLEEIKKYAETNKLELEVKEEYSNLKKGTITQSIEMGKSINENDKLIITISLGKDYSNSNYNELGRIPIMMYHGIHNKMNSETSYTGGNVDKDGYQRTKEAFKNDLEFYYKNSYRMIRLVDYVNGIIDVEENKTPIVLTFDDGLSNNMNILGLDDNGNLIIDENCAVGILESFKKKYPDFNVTATFFVNGGLFSQSKYNEKILNWLVDNGYDIGNHSYNHADFTKVSEEQSVKEIGSLYQKLDGIIKGKYVNIVALPFGSPYSKTNANFKHIISGNYNGYEYNTVATLQVGWEADSSPYSKDFDSQFIKRIRAYDNNGKDFDIEMNFKLLEKNRYISDGDKNTIVVKKDKASTVVNKNNLEVIGY